MSRQEQSDQYSVACECRMGVELDSPALERYATDPVLGALAPAPSPMLRISHHASSRAVCIDLGINSDKKRCLMLQWMRSRNDAMPS